MLQHNRGNHRKEIKTVGKTSPANSSRKQSWTNTNRWIMNYWFFNTFCLRFEKIEDKWVAFLSSPSHQIHVSAFCLPSIQEANNSGPICCLYLTDKQTTWTTLWIPSSNSPTGSPLSTHNATPVTPSRSRVRPADSVTERLGISKALHTPHAASLFPVLIRLDLSAALGTASH